LQDFVFFNFYFLIDNGLGCAGGATNPKVFKKSGCFQPQQAVNPVGTHIPMRPCGSLSAE
jgi:hypothetical protein